MTVHRKPVPWGITVWLAFLLAGCATTQPPAPAIPSLPSEPTISSAPSAEPAWQGPQTPPPASGAEDEKVEGTHVDERALEADRETGAKSSPEDIATLPAADGAKPGIAMIGPSTPGEQAEALGRALDKSLSDFDGMLLREQKILEERRSDSSTASSSGSAGGSAGGSGRSGTAATGEESHNQEGDSPRSGGGGGGRSTGTSRPGDEEKMAGRIPPDIGDGNDDDIVARQLREAAIQEEDPELREKLWDEYRKYRKAGD